MTAPLLVGDKCLGAIQLINPLPGYRSFGDSCQQTLKVLASASAMALQNARMTANRADKAVQADEQRITAKVRTEVLRAEAPEGSHSAALTIPSESVVRDFNAFMPTSKGLAFCLGEIHGEGDVSVMLTRVATLWRILVQQLAEPSDVLDPINREIFATQTDSLQCRLISGFRVNDYVKLASAGGQSPVHAKSGDQGLSHLDLRAPAIGVQGWSMPGIIKRG